MSFLFTNKYRPVVNIIGGIRVSTSLQGQPISLVYGRTRIAPNLLWYGDFFSKKFPTPGLSGSSGQTVGQFDYGAAVVLGLCQGPIAGSGAIWSGQGNLPVNQTQETYVVPGGGGSYTAIQQATYLNDLGVMRGDSYTVTANDTGAPSGLTLNGVQQTPMIFGSTATGHYTRSGIDNATYNFGAGDAGKTMTINYTYAPLLNTGGTAVDPIHSIGFTLFNGALGQAVWSYLTSKHPSQAIGYSGVAYMATPILDLGGGAVIPNFNFEIYGLLYNSFASPSWMQFGPGHSNGQGDVNPADVIYDLLTNTVYGCNIEPSQIGSMTPYLSYCAANNLFISPAIDAQRTATDWIRDILNATNSEIIETDGQLVVVPYGDTTIVANGVTFVPQTQPVYDLTIDDFIRTGQTPAVQVERPTVQDAFNAVTIEYVDRGNAYNPTIVQAQDLQAIDAYKYRPEGTRQYHMYTTQVAAAQTASTVLARLVYIRNKYKFKVTQKYIRLNPMDLVTITVPELAYSKKPVRIISIDEQANRDLEIQAEDFPWGCSGPTLYPKQTQIPGGANAYAPPGSVNPPILFEALSRLNNQVGHSIWFGLSGGQSIGQLVADAFNRASLGSTWATQDNAMIINASTDIEAGTSGSVRNSSYYLGGPIASAAIGTAGSGFNIGDLLSVAGGSGGVLAVATIGGGGAIATLSVTTPGSGYISGSQALTVLTGSGTGSPTATITITAFVANQSSLAQITATGGGAGDFIGVAARMSTSADTYYFFEVQAAGNNIALYKMVAGTPTLLASGTQAVSVGDFIEIRCFNSTIMGLWNGNVVLMVNDATIATGQPGMYGTKTSAGIAPMRANNWVGSNIVGGNSNWGGCNVWVSIDGGTNYIKILSSIGQVQMGTLLSSLASHVDPDTANTLNVDLTESFGALVSGTQVDADLNGLLCYVDGELISYETATLTAAFQYGLTYLRRGVFNSTIGAHAAGSPFIYFNNSVEGWNFDLKFIGQTVFFKFTSFNQSGLVEESLANVTAYAYTIAGSSIGLLTPAHASYRPVSNPLTAHDAGSSVTINIAAFLMAVPGQANVSYASASITGLAYGSLYYVYIDDQDFSGQIFGTTHTYIATTTKTDLLGNAGRLFIGSILTPLAGASDTTGNNDGGGGANIGNVNVYYPGQTPFGTVSLFGNGSVTNPTFAYDAGDLTNFAQLQITGNGSLNEADMYLAGPPGIVRNYSGLTLVVTMEVPTNTLPGVTGVWEAFYGTNGFSSAGNIIAPNINIATGSGITLAKTTYRISLPLSINPALFSLRFVVTTGSGASGTLTMKVYDVHLEAAE